MGSAFTYGRRYALSAMLGIVTEDDDDGNAASWQRNRCKNAKSNAYGQHNNARKNQQDNRIPLSKLFTELGIEDLLPCYREYLRETYGGTTDKMTPQQYEEQKAMLESCRNEPLNLRNFMRTLHGYKQEI